MIVSLKRKYAGADIDDDTSALMPQNRRKNPFRVSPGKSVVISMTNPGCFDFNQNFTGFWTRKIHFFNRQWGTGLPGNSSSRFHQNSPRKKFAFVRHCNARCRKILILHLCVSTSSFN